MKLVNERPTVLVTDGENRSSLAATRSLGRYGCRVVVSGKSRKTLSSFSNFCAVSYSVADSFTHADSFLSDILSIAEQEKIDFIYPMSESSIFTLSKNRAFLPEKVQLATPYIEQLDSIFNKIEVFEKAQKLNLAIPRTIFIKDKDAFLNKIPQIDFFPVVIKPGRSLISSVNKFIHTNVSYANNYEDLIYQYKTKIALTGSSMIQEKIIGPGTGLFTLFDRNRHIVLFSHKRVREKPPSGGVSVISQSIPLDTQMVDASQKLLSAAKWRGVAMVEFKRDQRDGRAKLIEINGRFWGTLQLAIAAGIDFPVLLLLYLQGILVSPQNMTYKQGLKMKWIMGTVDHLLIRLKNEDEKNLSPNFQSKMKSVLEFFRIKEQQMVFDVFQREDMVPFLFEVKKYMHDLLYKRMN